MSADTHGFLVRFPPEMWDELEEAKWLDRLTKTEIVLQAVAIWLHAIPRDKRAVLLERIGYQAQRQPGRPRREAVTANGSGPEKPAPDGWGLE
jgi:hypothetical protein